MKNEDKGDNEIKLFSDQDKQRKSAMRRYNNDLESGYLNDGRDEPQVRFNMDEMAETPDESDKMFVRI
jgi:hypothetical protein